MPRHGRERNQELIAKWRFLSHGVQVTFGAIALERPNSAGKSSRLVVGGDINNGQGMFVAVGRGWSQRVGGHHLSLAQPTGCSRAVHMCEAAISQVTLTAIKIATHLRK
jgi:hypothetical protein